MSDIPKHEFQFSHDWFTGNIPHWQKHLSHLRDKPTRALEIGCFEGRATVWMLENLLAHPDSFIDVIDTFEGSREHAEAGISFVGVRERFEHNIKPWEDRVDIRQASSLVGLLDSLNTYLPNAPYDLIYIDGSHTAPDVLTDAILSWPLLKVGGTLIFDDYLWGEEAHPPQWKPKPAIDAFLLCFEGQYEVLHKEYQVMIRRAK